MNYYIFRILEAQVPIEDSRNRGGQPLRQPHINAGMRYIQDTTVVRLFCYLLPILLGIAIISFGVQIPYLQKVFQSDVPSQNKTISSSTPPASSYTDLPETHYTKIETVTSKTINPLSATPMNTNQPKSKKIKIPGPTDDTKISGKNNT